MSDEDDPFEQFEDVSDREGDPFESLDGPDGDDETTAEDSNGGEEVTWESGGERQGPDPTGPGQAPEGMGGPAVDPTAPDDGSAQSQVDTDGDRPGRPGASGSGTGGTDPLAGNMDTGEPPGAADGAAQPGEEEPAVETTTDGPSVETGTDEAGIGAADDPFGDVAGREGDPFEDGDAFQRMDVGDIDPDEVWESLSEAEQRGSVSETEDHVYAEVSKHSFCEHCEHFSAPPDVACSHDGTEILEFVDMETVRLLDCPVVAERRELEDEQ